MKKRKKRNHCQLHRKEPVTQETRACTASSVLSPACSFWGNLTRSHFSLGADTWVFSTLRGLRGWERTEEDLPATPSLCHKLSQGQASRVTLENVTLRTPGNEVGSTDTQTHSKTRTTRRPNQRPAVCQRRQIRDVMARRGSIAPVMNSCLRHA